MKPLATLGDVFDEKTLSSRETREIIVNEILSLEEILNCKQKVVLSSITVEQLNEYRGSLRLRWKQSQKDKKLFHDRKAHEGYNQKLENSTRRCESIYVPKSGPLESCETPKCNGVVYGRQRFCDECRKKKQKEKEMKMGIKRTHQPDKVWKETIPNVILLKEKLGCTLQNAFLVYIDYMNVKTSLGVFYKRKQEFISCHPTLTEQQVNEIRLNFPNKKNFPTVFVKPQEEDSIAGGGELSLYEKMILTEIRSVLMKQRLDRVLDWFASLPNNEETVNALQQIQTILTEKLDEAIKTKQEEEEKKELLKQLEKEKEELEAKLAKLHEKLK